MRPKGNIKLQPPQETEGGIIMSIEVNRREFLKIVFASTTVVAVSGASALWPQDAFRLGLELIDGDHPGSDFVGIAFRGNVTELNRELEQLGMNLIIT